MPFVPALVLLAVLLVMAGEAVLSAHNERVLRARGAVEPEGDVYHLMRWAYPASFVLMAAEGSARGPAPRDALVAGLVVFGLAKALKVWAMGALGVRWTFRVLVLRDAALVRSGPYRVIRHPNYVAVVGELIGVALMTGALLTGALAVAAFGTLLVARIRVEDRALGRR